jgi:RNA polymerase-binding transcription factor DksA
MHYHYFTLEQRSTLARLLSQLPEAERHPALERLHAADYGVCETCGGDIPFVRLMSDPLRRRCPSC